MIAPRPPGATEINCVAPGVTETVSEVTTPPPPPPPPTQVPPPPPPPTIATLRLLTPAGIAQLQEPIVVNIKYLSPVPTFSSSVGMQFANRVYRMITTPAEPAKLPVNPSLSLPPKPLFAPSWSCVPLLRVCTPSENL